MMPPHMVVHDVLDADTLERLTAIATDSAAPYSASRIHDGLDPDFRRSQSLPGAAYSAESEVLAARIRALLPDALPVMGMKPLDVAGIEMQLLAYPDGAFYRAHIDIAVGASREASDRVVTGVFYFHREPKGFEGGELRLHAFAFGGAEGFVDVVPVRNSLLLFPAWARHEVRPVQVPSGRLEDSRLAINCWVRVAR